MKTKLLSVFICIATFTLSYAQSERKVITYIDSVNKLASRHYEINDIKQSYNYLLETIKLSDSINDDYGNAQANFLLGNIYKYIGLFKEAEESYLKTLEKAKLIDDNYLIAKSYLSLGEIKESEKPLNLLPYFNSALKYALKNNVVDENNSDKKRFILFEIRMKLSHLYIAKNQRAEAYLNLLEADKYLDQNPYSKSYLSYTYGLYYSKILSSYNLADKKFTEAISYLGATDKADATTNSLISKIYKEKSIALGKLEKNEDAYQALINYNTFSEKYLNEERIKEEKITKSTVFLEIYKNIARIANEERAIQETASNKIKNIVVIISVFVIILLVLFFILIMNYRSKRRLSLILKEQNELLEIAKNQAEKSNKLKSEFVSNVTHELRTPLYGVVGLTSLLLDSNSLVEEDHKMLKSLKYSGDYLLNLVNDILQIGKMESEKVELKNVSVNLKEMLIDIIGSFEYRLKESNNEIYLLTDDKIPELIICDSVRLSQILINLIGNSVKFTSNGKIFIHVIMLNLNTDKVSLRFEIEDNGVGIPAAKHKAIFNSFTQLEGNSNNLNYQGTGLGLSIVEKLVTLFNSKMELKSEVGKGSVFSFNVVFNIDKEGLINKKTKKAGKVIPLNHNYRILIAEDNKINQIVTKSLLIKANFQCDVVENGLECVEAFKTKAYDLILMDINMPVMDGNEATKEIRKINLKVPIIALTAADIDEVKKNLKQIGYSGIITKPFDNFEFFQTINSYFLETKSSL